jgi:peptide subunit release factor 1 (eRF1)
MPEFLTELEKGGDPAARSVYLPPGLSTTEIELLLANADIESLPEEAVQQAGRSATGAVLFWGGQQKYLVSPPFPLSASAVHTGYVAGPLRLWLQRDRTIGLVLVHLGSYGVGLCQGERLITSKVGTGLVHGRHKKGGSSQMRFQRRREKQATEFLDRVCLHIREQLEPQARTLDHVAYGGPRQTVLLLQKRCPFLHSLADRVLPLLDVPSPRREVLEKTLVRVWSSGIIEWQEA